MSREEIVEMLEGYLAVRSEVWVSTQPGQNKRVAQWMAPGVERLLADERADVVGRILGFNTQLGCTPQEGYKDLADALRDTKHLIAQEREKVREMCAEYLEKEASKCIDFADKESGETRAAWYREESWYQNSADAVRQLDLTKDLAPSREEGKR